MPSDRQAARDAAARARGFSSYYYERKAKAQQRGYAGYREQRIARTGKAPLKGGDRPGKVSRPPRVQINPSGMTVITSRDWRYLARVLPNYLGQVCAVRLTVGARSGSFRTYDTARLDDRGAAIVAGFRRLLLGEGWGAISGKVQVIVGRGEISVSELFPHNPKKPPNEHEPSGQVPGSAMNLRHAVDDAVLDPADAEDVYDLIDSYPDTPDDWEDISDMLDSDEYWSVLVAFYDNERS